MKKYYIKPEVDFTISIEETKCFCATSEIEKDENPYGNNPGEEEFDTKEEKQPATKDVWEQGW